MSDMGGGDYRSSELVITVELHRTLARYRRSYERGEISREELQRSEREAEEAWGRTSGTSGVALHIA